VQGCKLRGSFCFEPQQLNRSGLLMHGNSDIIRLGQCEHTFNSPVMKLV